MESCTLKASNSKLLSSLTLSDVILDIKNKKTKILNSEFQVGYYCPPSKETGQFYLTDQVKGKYML